MKGRRREDKGKEGTWREEAANRLGMLREQAENMKGRRREWVFKGKGRPFAGNGSVGGRIRERESTVEGRWTREKALWNVDGRDRDQGRKRESLHHGKRRRADKGM